MTYSRKFNGLPAPLSLSCSSRSKGAFLSHKTGNAGSVRAPSASDESPSVTMGAVADNSWGLGGKEKLNDDSVSLLPSTEGTSADKCTRSPMAEPFDAEDSASLLPSMDISFGADDSASTLPSMDISGESGLVIGVGGSASAGHRKT